MRVGDPGSRPGGSGRGGRGTPCSCVTRRWPRLSWRARSSRFDDVYAPDYVYVGSDGRAGHACGARRGVPRGASSLRDDGSAPGTSARVHDDTAVVQGQTHSKVVADGREIEGDFRYVGVWVRRDGKMADRPDAGHSNRRLSRRADGGDWRRRTASPLERGRSRSTRLNTTAGARGATAGTSSGQAELSVIRERMPPGTAELRHFHRAARQFFFVLSGAAVLEAGGTEHQLRGGEGVEVVRRSTPDVGNRSQADVEFLVVRSLKATAIGK